MSEQHTNHMVPNIKTRRTSIVLQSKVQITDSTSKPYISDQFGNNQQFSVQENMRVLNSDQIINTDTQKILGPTKITLMDESIISNTLQVMPSLKMDIEDPLDLRRNSSFDEKRMNKKPKRRKVLIRQAEQFFPDFLNFIGDYHYKHAIREGWRYQAVIPEQCEHRHKTHKLVNVWKSSNQFDDEILKDFKVKFGDNRTQEELCMIKLQLQCEWKEIPRYLEANKQMYKKAFKEKDKNLMKAAKTTY